MGQINLTSKPKRIAYKDATIIVTQSETYSRISADQIIYYASENSGIPKAQMASAFYAINQVVEQFLLNGHSLELMNLGSLYFSVSAKAVEDEVDAGAKAVRRLSIKFRQSKRLRDLINSNVQLVSELTKSGSLASDNDDDSDGDDDKSNPDSGTPPMGGD